MSAQEIAYSKRHEHTTDCIVPVTEVTRPREGTGHVEPVHDADGICRYDVWETAVGCSVLRIPIFPRKATRTVQR